MSRTGVRVLAVVACVMVGALGGLQSHLSGNLTESIGGGFLAAVVASGIYCAVGFVVLAVWMAVSGQQRNGIRELVEAQRAGRVIGWEWFGTLAGTVVGFSQAALVPGLGVALFTICFVAGQASFSLIADRVGLGPGNPRPITATRLTAALLALGGVALAVGGGLGEGFGSLGLAVFALVAGAALTVQQAANGRLGAQTSSPVSVAFIAYALGMLLILAVLAITLIAQQTQFPGFGDATTWWGGLIGLAFVLAGIVAVPLVGVLVVSLCFVAGQVVGSLAIGLLIASGIALEPWRAIMSAALVLAGVALSFVSPGSAASTTSEPTNDQPRKSEDL